MQKLKLFGLLWTVLLLNTTVTRAVEVKGVTLSESIKGEIKTITKTGESYKTVELKRVTQGLRQKKVALFWASVYVAQVFTNAKPDFTSVDKLRESLAAGLPLTVTMTFLRDIDNKKIVDGYKDVFKGNGIKIDEEPVLGMLDAVQKSGDVKDKQVYQFNFLSDAASKFEVRFKTHDKDLYTAKGLTQAQVDSFLKMWLGKPVDSGLEQLQEYLMKPNEKI